MTRGKGQSPERVYCSRCIYSTDIEGIYFDKNGECQYCKEVDDLRIQFGTGTEKGASMWKDMLWKIKKRGRRNKYDCIIGVSGGTDSSYLVHLAKNDWGLRPLAVHYDNTWNSAVATCNIYEILTALNVDLYTHVVNNKEIDDIYRAFFMAGVPELGATDDLAYACMLRQIAALYGIRYIIEGHSFVEEGISPISNNYIDGKYIKEVYGRYGSRALETYPLLTFSSFLKSLIIDRPVFVRPYWYLEYDKIRARETLAKEYGWTYYGGHHLENRLTAFCHNIYLPRKFGVDFRNLTLAANARSGKLTREEALAQYNMCLKENKSLKRYFCQRIGITDSEFEKIMREKPVSHDTFPNYKNRFRRLKPLFFLMAKLNLVTMSFYRKYCR